ncbi:sulfate transporter CysZ [Thiohalomonas denitrificans]|uniref:Sulfate transporter CysZ n=1 Tax=Thiohalomonas denitrificans TaxID=415747 RepID=A0A1G5PII0_9GAMM|nr:sulfate transporter CysZ [Thiohalomonas denitrificans]SCZ49335.1 CysZ protein [Thiohalomonas denitrificans]
MIQKPFIGASSFFRGVRLLTEPGLKRFVAIPLAINVAVFSLLLWVALDQFGALIDYLLPQLPEWLAWLAWLAWLSWLLWAVFGIAALVLIFFSFSIIANLIAAPFNGFLAEAVERHLTGRPANSGGGLTAALKAAPGAVIDELGKLLYFAKWAVPMLLLFLIPGINLIAPFAWMAFSAWMLAVEYSDYPLGNHGLKAREQRQRLGAHRPMALGFGGVVLVTTMIPIVNFLVMPAAVAGATVMWVQERQKIQHH